MACHRSWRRSTSFDFAFEIHATAVSHDLLTPLPHQFGNYQGIMDVELHSYFTF